MTTVHPQRIDHPSAWTSARLGGRSGLELPLSAEVLGAIDAVLDRTSRMAPLSVTHADFAHPILASLMDDVARIVHSGRGAVLLTGISPRRYSEEQMQRLYWGLGTYLGTAAVQSQGGDLLGYVQSADDDPHQRGYRSPQELNMHTDSYEIVGLMSVRTAETGGTTGLVSGLAIHNEILTIRPEILPLLYEGYYYASEEARFSDRPVTEEKIPVFTSVDGVVSCAFEKGQMKAAAQRLGVIFPEKLEEAIDCFRALAVRPDLALSFLLEPGEILLWNNFVMLHSRTAYQNRSQAKRLLWRLWLTPPESRRRPVDPLVKSRAKTYERLYREAQHHAQQDSSKRVQGS